MIIARTDIAVDAKTTASGSLGDNQVDWETLKEHRKNHGAKYSLLVAPDPTGKRLMDRARKSSVGVLSAEQLAYLCRGHARAPLSLVDYEQLFAIPGRDRYSRGRRAGGPFGPA